MATRKVCLITGAAFGLGRSMAEQLASEGWAVAANDIDGSAVEALVQELQAKGASALALPGDVCSKADVEQMAQATVSAFGQIDALVNNAGILHPVSVLDLTEADWDRVMDTNLKGAFLCAQAVSRHMVERSIHGRIVNIGSITGKIPRWGESAYCASKAGMHMLTKVMALELGGLGITVNTLSPGSADAGVLWHHLGGDRSRVDSIIKGDPEKFRLGIPTGRLASVADVNASLFFLLSDGAAQITGHELFVDGGQAMF